MIGQFPAALGSAACEQLVQLAAELTGAGPSAPAPAWGPATYVLDRRLQGAPRTALLEAVQACADRLCPPAGNPGVQVYVDTVALTVLRPGDGIEWHADNCEQDGAGRWVPNACSQRCVSAVLYLNEAFEGGEIVFDQQGLAIRPRTGHLIAFPSGHRYTHRVEKVRSGSRYALGIWFTAHRWHALLPERYLVAAGGA